MYGVQETTPFHSFLIGTMHCDCPCFWESEAPFKRAGCKVGHHLDRVLAKWIRILSLSFWKWCFGISVKIGLVLWTSFLGCESKQIAWQGLIWSWAAGLKRNLNILVDHAVQIVAQIPFGARDARSGFMGIMNIFNRLGSISLWTSFKISILILYNFCHSADHTDTSKHCC